MDAVKFIKEKLRMCNNIKDCKDCGFSYLNNKTNKHCETYVKEYPEEAVAIVEKWSQEHPRKTMLQDFLEKYPKARLRDNGTPKDVCPDTLGYCEEVLDCIIDKTDCVACWNRPLEE